MIGGPAYWHEPLPPNRKAGPSSGDRVQSGRKLRLGQWEIMPRSGQEKGLEVDALGYC